MRLTLLVAIGLVLFAVGLGVATGGAEACTISVAGHCIGGGPRCDPDGETCYPCDPYPGHPLGGGC